MNFLNKNNKIKYKKYNIIYKNNLYINILSKSKDYVIKIIKINNYNIKNIYFYVFINFYQISILYEIRDYNHFINYDIYLYNSFINIKRKYFKCLYDLNNKNLTKYQINYYIKAICNCLINIMELNHIHGCLNPYSILLDDNNNCYLADYSQYLLLKDINDINFTSPDIIKSNYY